MGFSKWIGDKKDGPSPRERKKQARRARLCQNNVYRFDRRLTKKEKQEIDEWCENNLNGIHHWIKEVGSNYWFDDISYSEIGFHHKWDLVAFKLRWDS